MFLPSLGKQHNDRDWALNHQPLDLKTNELTTTPPPLLTPTKTQTKQDNIIPVKSTHQLSCRPTPYRGSAAVQG